MKNAEDVARKIIMEICDGYFDRLVDSFDREKLIEDSSEDIAKALQVAYLKGFHEGQKGLYERGAEDMRSRILHRIEEREIASMNQERAQWAAELFAELKAIPLHPEGGGR